MDGDTSRLRAYLLLKILNSWKQAIWVNWDCNSITSVPHSRDVGTVLDSHDLSSKVIARKGVSAQSLLLNLDYLQHTSIVMVIWFATMENKLIIENYWEGCTGKGPIM